MQRTLIVATASILTWGIGFSQMTATATQTVLLEVRSVSAVEVSGDPSPLTITTGIAGSSDLSVASTETRYRLTSNRSSMKLAVSVDAPLPAGTTLFVEMQGGSGVSRGPVDISSALAPVDAVTDIGRGTTSDQQITYTFIASADTGPVPPQQRTILLTLTD